MEQKELIRRFKNKNIEDIDIRSAAKYFRSARTFYGDLQDGKASDLNFFERTMVMYEECEKPNRKPDFVSDSGSQYWYTKKGVTRRSNHWGNGVYNCDWPIHLKNGRYIYGRDWQYCMSSNKVRNGFARWEDYMCKPRLLKIKRKEVVTCFNNVIGRDIVIVDGKQFVRKIIETYVEEKE
jgi:hypothetical protein